jgi:hypothetical protein
MERGDGEFCCRIDTICDFWFDLGSGETRCADLNASKNIPPSIENGFETTLENGV